MHATFITSARSTTAFFRVLLCGLFFLSFTTYAQKNSTGTVIDAADRQPLPGASVRVIGTQRGITTKSDGTFSLSNLPATAQTLEVSYLGYEKQRVNLDPSQPLQIALVRSSYMADEVVVSATRANQRTGMAFTNVGGEEIQKQNLGQDLPVLLNFQPSLVSTSEAGAGIGYTGFRIRGSDATRINVTLNGIPYNDAESQGLFWVNMPDFASSTTSIQIQRGVGTSTNGAGAFGATVNVQTNEFRKEAYAETNHSVGSFHTIKNNVLVGSGLINGKFTVDARLSRLTSDGYIDRAGSNLKSFYLSGAYFGKKSFVRLNVFSGIEKTYQAWNGVPETLLKTNRTYNEFTYDNQTDNYQQDNYQLLSSHQLSRNWTFNFNLHYTKGRGYFEEYKPKQKLSEYRLLPVVIGGVTIDTTTLIRRKWLDNDFYGTVFSFDYDSFKKLKVNIGGGWNKYTGKHFGEVIWARFASNSNIRTRYYEDDASKTDLNFYAKAYYQLTEKLNVFADAQFRKVDYDFYGIGSLSQNTQQQAALRFFNPKLGLNYQINEHHSAYASFSVAHREPNREDYTQSTIQSRPKAEGLQDWEAGYRYQSGKLALNVNGYYMNYRDQLVLTGKLNDVGSPTRTNAGKSYRSGIEVEGAFQFTKTLTLNANATFSRNKIKTFTAYYDNYDVYDALGRPTQTQATFNNTDISFSPNVIAGGQLLWKPVTNLELGWLAKYVGKQYLDNTQDENRKLTSYFTNDIRAIYSIKPKFVKEINLSLLLNNVFNRLYESNGYTFSYTSEGQFTTENYYYPQAGFNFLAAIGIKF
ncbi:TonB-dependent receptor [Siphonobacter sp. SORGH_AS_1065]|uniref:TonB-dependent receptor n=1 Tax=Siphonobacter sp. SORGH_AS_1065 TaxID=3041795 RepID=UPI00278224F7|nr:TonB-dependent receptor [Siphonobacter sp. SORGH_AS_1065]MDQ1087263.1 iron complex outermembrane receptor protein [Siphonobacter sp. SORGH_AS_1065]